MSIQNNIQVIAVTALKDNYIWLLVNPENGCVICVDPGEAKPVINFLEKHHLTLQAILLTHSHADHVAGVAELLERYSNDLIAVYGSVHSSFPLLTHFLTADEQIDFPQLGLSFTALATPGHTIEHMCYYSQPLLFCGDTLFTAGCGRVFNGTMTQLFNSLIRLKNLPDDTLVYCGHEYTLHNLRFAIAVEPHNEAIQQRIQQTEQLRQQGEITVPALMSLERQTNPFLRCDKMSVTQAVEQHYQQTFTSEEQIFVALRNWKNNF